MLRASGRPAALIERIAGPEGHLSNRDSAEAAADLHHVIYFGHHGAAEAHVIVVLEAGGDVDARRAGQGGVYGRSGGCPA